MLLKRSTFHVPTLNPKSLPIPAAQERSQLEAKAAVGEGFEISGRIVTKENIFQFYLFFVTIAHHQVRSLARIAFCTKPRLPWIGCAKGARQGVYKLFNTGQNFKTGPQWDHRPTMGCLAHNGVLGPQISSDSKIMLKPELSHESLQSVAMLWGCNQQ